MMTPEQIIANHIQNNGLETTVPQMIKEVNTVSKLPKSKIVRSGDVMFVFTVKGDSALIYIINGGNSTGYIRALRQFVLMMKKLEIKYIKMRVQDTNSAKKISDSAGLKNQKFEITNEGETDPYTMTAEV